MLQIWNYPIFVTLIERALNPRPLIKVMIDLSQNDVLHRPFLRLLTIISLFFSKMDYITAELGILLNYTHRRETTKWIGLL